MPVDFPSSVGEQASSLVAEIVSTLTHRCNPSSMSTNVYDTAWVSMIAKEVSGEMEWLFPKAFNCVLKTQTVSGHWDEEGPRSNSIVSTLAALLAILKHQKNRLYVGCPALPQNITVRISKAVLWLEREFDTREDDCVLDSVALELIVSSHVRLLEDYGIRFDSPFLQHMKDTAESRLSKLNLDALYSGEQMTVLHSLEALVGLVDFSRLRSCSVRGSMLGSPSSTAAYLQHAQIWDDDAELYLKDVFMNGGGKGNGTFPSAAPIEIFEISWVLSTLLEGGFTSEMLGRHNTSLLATHLSEALQSSGGIVGFSPDFVPDVDDTAKCLQTLALLDDHGVGVDKMITQFWSPSTFRTYENERTPSISANCNVLKALLSLKSPTRFTTEIITASSFICDAWMSGTPHDKWNTAWEYCAMLSAQGLVRLLELAESEPSEFLPSDIQHTKIPITVSRIACRVLHSQAADGSFGNGCDEITAYATLTLVALTSSHVGLSLISNEILVAISDASKCLRSRAGCWDPRRIWIEKVTYSSELLTKTYCLAALNRAIMLKATTTSIVSEDPSKVLNLFRSVPLFSSARLEKDVLQLALQESRPYLHQLEHTRFDIFPRPLNVNEKYLHVIPLAWTACNYLLNCPIPPKVLMDMMEISMLNYQADEYIEAMVPQCRSQDVVVLQDQLDVKSRAPQDKLSANGLLKSKRQRTMITSCGLTQSIFETLSIYIDRILDRTHVQEVSGVRREQLRAEVVGYVQAQIMSVGAKSRLGEHGPYYSFYEWVHTLGARDTSCPFSFNYFLCLVYRGPISFETDYHLRDTSGSLSRLCRMYNDYGSLSRDLEEGNLNSMDFFFNYQKETSSRNDNVTVCEAKRAILSLAESEREQMTHSLAKLRNVLKLGCYNAVQVLINVTELFGQIYVAQDIGSRTKTF